MKKILNFTFIFICFILGFLIIKKTWATNNSTIELDIKLEYSNDTDILNMDAIKYIDLIDNSLFETYTIDNISNLNEDYEFMTNFAISFIFANKDYYKNNIVTGDIYNYTDEQGNIYTTNKYVNLDTLYDVTDSVFGIRDYVIINNNLNINNNLIPLLINNNVKSEMNIDNIEEIKEEDGYYLFYVKYKNLDYKYIYKFKFNNNILYLVNIDIEV